MRLFRPLRSVRSLNLFRREKKSDNGDLSLPIKSSSPKLRSAPLNPNQPAPLLALSLTLPLIQRQVCVVHGLIVGQRFGLLLGVSELAEEGQLEGLRRAHPLLGVQQQHLLQDTHRCDAHTHTHVEVSMTRVCPTAG